jgi:hypothetical protein
MIQMGMTLPLTENCHLMTIATVPLLEFSPTLEGMPPDEVMFSC